MPVSSLPLLLPCYCLSLFIHLQTLDAGNEGSFVLSYYRFTLVQMRPELDTGQMMSVDERNSMGTPGRTFRELSPFYTCTVLFALMAFPMTYTGVSREKARPRLFL